MTRTRKIVRFVMLSLGVIVLVGVAGLLWSLHEFQFNISQTDMEPVETTLKKALSDTFVLRRPDSRPASVSGGYIVAYQRDPEGFRKDAKLLDAWMASPKVGLAALKNTPRGNWVGSSADADYVASQDRVDPWKHTFCLLRRDDDVLVVSGGPKAPSSPACRDIQLQGKDLAELPHGKLLESPAGYLILVVDKTHADGETLPEAKAALRSSPHKPNQEIHSRLVTSNLVPHSQFVSQSIQISARSLTTE